MNFDDLSFEIETNGRKYKCDILEVVPNDKNSDEPYVVFTNYDLDENDNFREMYGKLISINDEFNIDTELSDEEIKYIDTTREDEIVKYVNSAIEDAINE